MIRAHVRALAMFAALYAALVSNVSAASPQRPQRPGPRAQNDDAAAESDRSAGARPVLTLTPAQENASDEPRIDLDGAGEPRRPDIWVAGDYDAVGIAMTALTVAALLPMWAEDDEDAIRDTGDFLQYFLPASAYAFSAFARDGEGAIQFTKSLVSSSLVTQLVKGTVDKTRPDQTGNNSFPSGHTQAAFSGAAFINTRYGARFGVPAYLMAGFTGASRMLSSKHFGDDVLAGASFALFGNWLFAEPLLVGGAALSPVVGDDYVGVSLDFVGDVPEGANSPGDDDFERSFRYELQFGPATQMRNDLVLPRSSGSTLSITDFQDNSDPHATAMGTLEWYFQDRHELDFRWWPYEVRDDGTYSQDTSFGGENFSEGAEGSSRFLYYDYRFRYRYRVLTEPWDVRAGFGVAVQDLSETLSSGGVETEASTVSSFPLVHASVGYRFSPRWVGLIETDLGMDSSSNALDSAALVRFEATPRWDFSLGYRYVTQHISTSEVRHDLELGVVLLSIGYSM